MNLFLDIFKCAQKLTGSQYNLPDGTKKKQKRLMKKTKNKSRDAQKKRCSHRVCGVSPETRRESMVGTICDNDNNNNKWSK